MEFMAGRTLGDISEDEDGNRGKDLGWLRMVGNSRGIGSRGRQTALSDWWEPGVY